MTFNITKISRKKQLSDVEKLAQSFEPSIKKAFLNAVKKMRDSVTLVQLEEAIKNNNLYEIDTILDSFDLQNLKQEVISAVSTSAAKAAEQFPKNIATQIRFDLLNPKTTDFINAFTGDLITNITTDLKLTVRTIVEEAYIAGQHPYTTAQTIKNTGIGLSQKDLKAVSNYSEKLTTAGQLSKDQITNAVSKYSDKLLVQRSETIARTEALKATNAGQQSLWSQAKEQGLLDNAKKYYSITGDDRTSEICKETAALNSDGVDIDKPFQTPNGDFMQPPIHPNCRCSSVIRYNK